MFWSKKYYVYYHRVTIQEGLNIELNTSELMLGNYDKEIYQKSKHCHCVIEIKIGLKKRPLFAFKLLQNHDKSNLQIHITWTENQKYRVFTNLYRSFLNKLVRRENIKDTCGGISQKALAIYLNSST